VKRENGLLKLYVRQLSVETCKIELVVLRNESFYSFCSNETCLSAINSLSVAFLLVMLALNYAVNWASKLYNC